jgi:pimeloyl-ACP methyl ester carboxylesterase
VLGVYRSAAVRRWAFWKPLAKRGAPDDLDQLTFGPLWGDRRVLDDLVAVLASAHRDVLPRCTAQLAAYDGPSHVAWSRDDLIFPRRDAERLVRTLRHAELTWIDDARSFAHLDQPQVAAGLVRGFVERCRPVGPGPVSPERRR